MEDAQQATPPVGLEYWAPVVAAVVALVVAGLQIPGREDFCLDDAWIHLSYAKSLRAGDGLSYNPGDWETGFSSPLWVLALSVWPLAPDPVLPVKLLGTLLHGATAYLTAVYARDIARRWATLERPVPVASVAALAGTLAACTPVLVQGATSGMEVPLVACLVIAVFVATGREAWGAAAVLGALAVWARPEALFVLGAHGVLTAVSTKNWRALAALGGGVGALLAWVAYCLAVSGYPWPNTRYIKANEPGLDGLRYLGEQVLPTQPWIVSLGGAAMLGLGLWEERRQSGWSLAVLTAAWAVALLAVAVSRPLHPGVLFFESRYFALVAHLPAVPIALSLAAAGRRRWLVAVLALPLAALTAHGLARTTRLQIAQEQSVMRLHTRPSRWISQRAPQRAVIAVEGAGAQRYRTPRTMTVVDIVGLNDAAIAHAPTSAAKLCVIIEREPDYLIAPAQIIEPLAAAFEGRVVAEFPDPAFAQVEPAHPAMVQVVALDGVRPQWRERCVGAEP